MLNFTLEIKKLTKMKGFNILLVLLLVVLGCKGQESKNNTTEKDAEITKMASFGSEIEATGSVTSDEMAKTYTTLAVTDTLKTKFTGVVNEVCQAKGCWMKVALKDGSEAMVKFKDYGFFMPKDIAGKEVTMNGLAFVEEMSVEDQRHFAEDAGKTKEEIALITESKKTYSFEADGVLLRE